MAFSTSRSSRWAPSSCWCASSCSSSSSSSISFVIAFSSSFDVVVFWDIFYIVWCIFLWENKNTDRVKGIHFSTYVVLQCWAKLLDTIILYVSFGGNLYALLLSVSLAFFVLFGDICFQEGKRKMLSCKSVVSQSASRVQSWHRCEL